MKLIAELFFSNKYMIPTRIKYRVKYVTMTSMSERTKEESHISIEDIRNQMVTYGSEIQQYLKNVDAHVDGYKFSVEKQGDGLEVEVQFKANIRPKH